MKIKKGDTVKVLVGDKELKGKEGKVFKVDAKNNRVYVQGLNIVKKHRKPNQANPEGAIEEMEAPIHISNVALIDPKTKKPVRVGYKVEGDKKIRVCHKTGNKLD